MSDSTVTHSEARLHVVGDMSIYGAAAIRDQLLALVPNSGADIELDLSGVTALDTAGLQIMLVLRRLAASKGVAFRLVSPSAVAVEVLELCGLRNLIAQATLGEHVS